MQRASLAGSEAAALFLATHGAKVNHVNKWVCLNTHESRVVSTVRAGVGAPPFPVLIVRFLSLTGLRSPLKPC